LRDGFPASWFAIKDELSSSTRSYLTFTDYRAVCAGLGETNAGAQESLASYLHSLGIALNYKDDPRLQDTHVLNPHWVTNGIYKILNSRALQLQKGEIRLAQLQEILEPELYPQGMHRFLLDLMSKFEICFNFPDDPHHYLVPELLDNQEPAGLEELVHRPRLEFQYHYPILPEGLLPRFIVRTHNMSADSDRWRTGVVLKFEDNVALVRADVQDKKIFISVSGPLEFQRPFLAVLRSHLNDLHRAISKLAPIEMVPLPQFPDVVVPYEELRVLERQGIRTLPKVIGSEAIQFNVRALLNGVDAVRPLSGGVIRPEEPYSNVIRLRTILRASENYIFWVDLHFSARALEEIAASLDPSAVQTVKILSGPANLNDRARRDFARFQTELSRQNVSAEWRVLEDFTHDRFIITSDACYNVPPINSLLRGSYSEILPTPNRPPFEEWWERASPI
jgi:GTPase SAR1 family protein